MEITWGQCPRVPKEIGGLSDTTLPIRGGALPSGDVLALFMVRPGANLLIDLPTLPVLHSPTGDGVIGVAVLVLQIHELFRMVYLLQLYLLESMVELTQYITLKISIRPGCVDLRVWVELMELSQQAWLGSISHLPEPDSNWILLICCQD
jgi:hypothetical protein